MALISTSALRKITIFVLVVAAVSFGAAEIHKLFIVPSQKANTTQVPTEYASGVPTPDPDRFELVESITGIFQEWESIPNSSDRYTILTDPETGEPFPKIRVGFEFSSLFGGGPGGEDATVFAVEKSEDEYDVLGYLHEFTSGEVDKLIKQGDPVKIYLNKKDDDFLAHWLMIERGGGKSAVEQELGRKIEEPEKP